MQAQVSDGRSPRQELPVAAFLDATTPIIDVRSPAEFGQGHLPGAISLPLFSDAQRQAVGTAYKQQGRQQAVQLGLALVGPQLAELSEQLLALAGPGQGLRLHCWRGGQRSGSVAWLAGLQGLRVTLLQGGYKAYRQWVLQMVAQPWPLQVVGGRTGTGKTDLLQAMARQGSAVVDLEGLAQHRGSSFGGLGLPPQPSSEHFENRLAEQLRRLQDRGGPIWVEAESAQVGRCRIPAGFWRQMQQAPVLEIDRPVEQRLLQLVAVYGHQGQEPLRQATERISRRLGPQRTGAALAAIAQEDWAGACLQMLDYYDRCYDHELQTRPTAPRWRLGLGDQDADSAARQVLSLIGQPT